MAVTLDELGGWRPVLLALTAGQDLTADQAHAAMTEILAGAATDAQIAAYIVALRMKGEAVDEVSGMVDAMLEASDPIDLRVAAADAIDIVGTGVAPSRRAAGAERVDDGLLRGRRRRRAGVQARQPQGQLHQRLVRPARSARRRHRPRRAGVAALRRPRPASGSASPGRSTPRCATPARCGPSWASRPCSTSSARCRTRPGCHAR